MRFVQEQACFALGAPRDVSLREATSAAPVSFALLARVKNSAWHQQGETGLQVYANRSAC